MILDLREIIDPKKQQLRSAYFNRGPAVPRSWKPSEAACLALNEHVTCHLPEVKSIEALNHVVVQAASTLSASASHGKQPAATQSIAMLGNALRCNSV